MKAIKWWCDRCKIWVCPATASEIYKCPHCGTNLTSVKEWDAHYTVERSLQEANGMPGREYVIRSLKYLHDRETWKEGPLVWDDHAADRRRITADALSLLMEQEPVEPVKEQIFSSIYGWVCGACSFPLLSDSYAYCPRCGRAVKWNT